MAKGTMDLTIAFKRKGNRATLICEEFGRAIHYKAWRVKKNSKHKRWDVVDILDITSVDTNGAQAIPQCKAVG